MSSSLPPDIGILVDASIIIAGGYAIVELLSRAAYRVALVASDSISATSIRSTIRILGIGVLLPGTATILTNPQAGLAIGGFLGVVVGLATQQVLGQAIAGLTILITRPFRIGEKVVIGGWEPLTIVEISLMYTVGITENGETIYIPNSVVLNNRIVKRKTI
ncbi:MAG: mechanosensitive ion channel family protein [Sulfolobales archaeon]